MGPAAWEQRDREPRHRGLHFHPSFQVAIEFDEHINVAFAVVSAGCKVLHEFLGGYIFLSTRARPGPGPGPVPDEQLFHKLTGGHEAL